VFAAKTNGVERLPRSELGVEKNRWTVRLLDLFAGSSRLRKKEFRSLLPLSYLSHRERRLRKEASFYAGC
jgi:hypothetical protein